MNKRELDDFVKGEQFTDIMKQFKQSLIDQLVSADDPVLRDYIWHQIKAVDGLPLKFSNFINQLKE